MVQIITVSEVKSACRKAYEEERLIAQLGHDQYGYEITCGHTSYVCAIGAALIRQSLDRVEAKDLQTVTMTTGFESLRVVFDCSKAAFSTLCMIQNAHDAWLNYSLGTDEEEAAYREASFLDLIRA